MNPSGPYEEEDVAAALLQFNGNLTQVAGALGRTRRSVNNFIIRTPALQELLEEVESVFLDTVEGKYKDAALAGDETALRFFLTTKAKDRGYSTRVESTGKNGEPIEQKTTVDWGNLDDESLEKIHSALSRAQGSALQ